MGGLPSPIQGVHTHTPLKKKYQLYTHCRFQRTIQFWLFSMLLPFWQHFFLVARPFSLRSQTSGIEPQPVPRVDNGGKKWRPFWKKDETWHIVGRKKKTIHIHCFFLNLVTTRCILDVSKMFAMQVILPTAIARTTQKQYRERWLNLNYEFDLVKPILLKR